MSVTLTGLGVIRLVTAVAGAVNDIAEFGFAIVGTVIGMVRLERSLLRHSKSGSASSRSRSS